jgi:putative PIN family toxin of toxin-antitoxin system
MIRVVVDTNVWVSALRTAEGSAFKLLSNIPSLKFQICLSTALVLEYEDVLKRLAGSKLQLTYREVDIILDYLCANGLEQPIYYLWRPSLNDPGDEMVLELAANASCNYIVTYNVRHFGTVKARLGIDIVTPGKFLELMALEAE